MKPEDLKSPFSWHNRYVTIHDRVWYIPGHYDQYQAFSFPGWQHPDTFSANHPVKIEYCSGNGEWITAKALEDPTSNWVAVEMLFVKARRIWSKVKNHQLNNLLVVCGEGRKATSHYFPSTSVSEVFINFPDPWPKRRHSKHRIIQPAFIQEMERILIEGGRFTFVTDDIDYSELMIKVMTRFPNFESCFENRPFTTEMTGYGTSFFEELWRTQGKEIRYHQFYKRKSNGRRGY